MGAFDEVLGTQSGECLTESDIAHLELGANGVAGEWRLVASEEFEDVICQLLLGSGIRGVIVVDDSEVRCGLISEDETERLGGGSGTMLDAQDEGVVAAAQVEVGVSPGMQVSGSAQRLAAETRGGVFAQVMDENDRQAVSALQVTQLAEQGGHVGGGVLVAAMQAHEGIEQ